MRISKKRNYGNPCWTSSCPRTLRPVSNRRCNDAGRDASLRRRMSASATAAQEQTTEELKAAVVRAVSGTQRGKAASREQRAAILQLLEALEKRNKLEAPARSPLLSGVWALLYQAPLDESRAAVDRSGTTEGPFLAAFQPLTRDLVRTRANLQLLDIPGCRAENLAEFSVAGRWEGVLNIVGTAAPQPSGPQGGPSPTRVDVVFTHFELRLGSWNKLTVPLDWVKPKGWIETTYLDEDLRIGRGDKGSIFVASRVKDSRWRGAGPGP
ncbi:hypothetical protein PLESTB_000494300 [Pleodorina starrii]|uniref:Plastid lipid-associated protein/fibrillin conserved domain-containing protein n=1 Tax=Pleodorina starrii TaxID=330485 RepID=A0A9W6BG21_9CHLO|nr:hypothetical protein PLESTM_000365800 [Pleodorina starrii]GLC51363.1 hypothetical protein PLESTB_000494300 [Pleodorina starrii]GLC63728.1 hypothetical protein PLESTF_000067800 [Pleodorina starrii]